MLSSSNRGTESDTIIKAISMLEMLDRSADDHLILNHVRLLLEDYDQRQDESQQLLCSLISLLLGSFSLHLDQESTLYTQIKLLQFRLATPITQSELIAIQHYVESCADQISQSEIADENTIASATKTLINSFGLSVEVLSDEPNAALEARESKQDTETINQTGTVIRDFGESLQNFFSENYLMTAIEQSEQFLTLLEVKLAAIKHVNDQQSLEDIKNSVVHVLEKVLGSHRKMTGSIQQVSNFVSALQSDSKRLNMELDRVTLLSLTDELTSLPNRRAFLERLENEIARVKRYKHHLSVALLDIDHFKHVNDRYGHNTGDRVLRIYGEKVLSAFRQYDFVARYGGEEFVVIFPNTDKKGAYQALKKVQQRAVGAFVEMDGNSIPLPTFSAGLVEFQNETNVDVLINRADTLLYEAKLNGRNRIEMEYQATETTQNE